MKYRIFCLLLIGFLLSSTTIASERNKREVEKRVLYLDEEVWHDKGYRSIPFIPIITQEGNLIRIYSDIDLPNLQICVKDTSGNIVYLNTIFLSASQPYSFILPEMQIKESDCMIELIHGENFLFGYLDFIE